MAKKNIKFKAEAKQILDLMIHSLYSHKDIFLRELISNASDAIDRARYEALTNEAVLEQDGDFKIKIIVDKDKGFITVSDNGIGMSHEEAVKELGTIARSGTGEFLKSLQGKDLKDNPELIGQFGVGFYSSFMVADKVTVVSRKAGSADTKGVKWESGAEGTFSVEEVEKETKGTSVTLHIRDEQKQYLETYEIRTIVKKYSDFIEHPVLMDIEKEEDGKKTTTEERLNSGKALWLKPAAEVTEDEHKEFFRHISHGFGDPARTIHFKAEGSSEFSALLYIPSVAPFGILYRDYKIGPALYINRVLIMDHAEELLPSYLRFVSGVVDSSDLPLNVSREMLQSNRQAEIIKNSLTKKVLDNLRQMRDNDYDAYAKTYAELGRVLKEGIHSDYERKEKIADLLLFSSTETGAEALTTLDKYVDGMKPSQKGIYYVTGRTYEEAMKSPYIEAFKENNMEVLVLLDDIDDIIMGSLREYKEKPLISVMKGDVELDDAGKAEREKAGKEFTGLVDFMKEALKEKVKDVRFSGRLKDSACCLVADEGGMDPGMEQMLKAMGQNVPSGKKTLELNPVHPLVAAMGEAFKKDPKDPVLEQYAGLLYDQAELLAGSKLEDPAAFVKLITELMAKGIGDKG